LIFLFDKLIQILYKIILYKLLLNYKNILRF